MKASALEIKKIEATEKQTEILADLIKTIDGLCKKVDSLSVSVDRLMDAPAVKAAKVEKRV